MWKLEYLNTISDMLKAYYITMPDLSSLYQQNQYTSSKDRHKIPST